MEFGGLKVLMLSTDGNIFKPDSAVLTRMKEYGKLVEELHIVVLSNSGFKETQIDKNVWAYPTNTSIKFFRHKGAVRIGKRIIKSKNFVRGRSVITSQDPFQCGLVGLKLKSTFRLPLEVQLHTDPFSDHYKGFLNTLRKKAAEKVLIKADSIRVVSESLKTKLTTYNLQLTNFISVLPIYIDKQRIEEGQITFDLHSRLGWHFILLCVARLSPEKNLKMAIDVLKKVRSYYPDAGLVLVGSGPEEGSLKSYARTVGVLDYVYFAGWQEEVSTYYKTANIFIQTSNFEGYGLALVEAGLSGLPVVTTNVGIAEELKSGEDAYICPVGDAEFMFNAVYDLLKNNDKRVILKSNLKRTLEAKLLFKEEYLQQLKLNWEKLAPQIN